jgi:hypothetical protein
LSVLEDISDECDTLIPTKRLSSKNFETRPGVVRPSAGSGESAPDLMPLLNLQFDEQREFAIEVATSSRREFSDSLSHSLKICLLQSRAYSQPNWRSAEACTRRIMANKKPILPAISSAGGCTTVRLLFTLLLESYLWFGCVQPPSFARDDLLHIFACTRTCSTGSVNWLEKVDTAGSG